MLQNKRLLIALFASSQISRHICSSSAYSSLNRESRFIKKMISGSRKKSKKTKWYDTKADLHSVVPVSKTALSAHTERRMIIRDKIFMEHITDQISMGGLSDVVTENIEITRVKITLDFKLVNVYWTHNTTSSTSISEEELQDCARIIRQRLSDLRVIGVVPPIQFVEDKQCLMTKEVDKRLAIIKKDLESWFPCSEEELDALYINISDQPSYDETEQTIDDSREILNKKDSKTKESCIELPTMRHDVLALDHAKIMSRIMSSLSKANKASQRRLDMETTSVDNSCDPESKVATFLTQEEQQKIFSEFLITKRREEKRRYRQMKHQQKLLNDSWKDVVVEETDYEEYVDNDVDVHGEFDEEE